MDGSETSRDLHTRAGAVPDYADYRPLETGTVAKRIAAYPGSAERLGGAPGGWDVREVGDGDLDFVYIVTGPANQALPYVRLVGRVGPCP